MTWLLHRYRPFTVDALIALAREELARQRAAVYGADLIWLIAGRLSRGGFDLPAPSRFALQCMGGEAPREDTRTGAQIVQSLREGLRALR